MSPDAGVLHDRRRAAALRVDEEVGARVRGAHLLDVARADAGVDVALAVPDVQRAPELPLDERAEEHVRSEQDLRVGAVLAQDVLDDGDGVRGRHAVVRHRLDLGRRVDVHDGDRARVLRLPRAQLVGSDRVGERAAGREVGDQDRLVRAQHRGRLGHEVHAAERDRRGARAGGLLRQAERVAGVVRDVLDLGQLVVVREDHGVALAGELAHLGLELRDVVELQRRCWGCGRGHG